ncbi:MAG TPA: magnesium transporter [Candidatus Cloacimonadota bacterium]|nr:magnesium transporter [Candidatus Cloacimonadota bacterium]
MINTITEMIQKTQYKELKILMNSINVVDIAEMFEEINLEHVLIVFRLLNKEKAAEVFAYLSREHQQLIIESISDKEIHNIIDELFIDDTVDFLEEMPASVVKKVLKNTDEQTRKILNQFLNYKENSAGSIMTIEFVDLKKHMTVSEAIQHIRRTGVDKETINNCYVIDQNRKLEGIVSIRRLILAPEERFIHEIMETAIIKVTTSDDQEEIADLFKKYDLTMIPVVDKENCLVGIVTVDDIIDVIEQENTEDFQIMAAMTPYEDTYLKTNALIMAKNRILWLFVLMISATFTGLVIKRFEALLSSMVILTSYIPMLMGTGGNAGSQSSTLIIRSIALGEVEFPDLFKVLFKEFQVSFIVGLALALANFIRIIIIDHTVYKVAAIVSISLFFTIMMAKIIGSSLPLLAKKVGIDPAILASPLISTLVDATSLIIYFTLASKFIL